MLRPMLPSPGPLPGGPGWVAEPKMDGWRAVVEVSGDGKVTVYSRHGRNLTDRFPELAVLSGCGPVVLDGELVVCGDDGRPDFYALSRHAGEERKAELAVFDVLAVGDTSLVGEPYHRRREVLEGLDLPGCASPVRMGEVGEMWDATGEAGLEGVVAKRVDGTYRPGVRSTAWVKAKHWRLTTLVVCGYVPGAAGITALLVSTGAGRATGRIELGIRGPLRQALRDTLPSLRTGRSGDALLVEPCVKVVVRHHGDPSRPRDAVLHSIA